MAVTVREMNCHPEDVFAVLADAWVYPTWVVGAARMRNVDDGWPQPPARLYHSVGAWPALLNDTTSAVEWDPPHRMVMRARGWPLGEARVTIEVKPRGDGCVVRMQEDAVRGPATIVPRFLADLVLNPRNRETLKRLAYIAEERVPQEREREGRLEERRDAEEAVEDPAPHPVPPDTDAAEEEAAAEERDSADESRP